MKNWKPIDVAFLTLMGLSWLLPMAFLATGCVHTTFAKPSMVAPLILQERPVECFTTITGVTIYAHEVKCPDPKTVQRQIRGVIERTGSPLNVFTGLKLYYTSHTFQNSSPWGAWSDSWPDHAYVFYGYDWKRMTRHALGHELLFRLLGGVTYHDGMDIPPCEQYTETNDQYRTDYDFFYLVEFDGKEVYWVDSRQPRRSSFDEEVFGVQDYPVIEPWQPWNAE